jgi:hypothetical protein
MYLRSLAEQSSRDRTGGNDPRVRLVHIWSGGIRQPPWSGMDRNMLSSSYVDSEANLFPKQKPPNSATC